MALRQVCIAHMIKWAALLNRIEIGDRNSDAKARKGMELASEEWQHNDVGKYPENRDGIKIYDTKGRRRYECPKLAAIKKRPVLSKVLRGRVTGPSGFHGRGPIF